MSFFGPRQELLSFACISRKVNKVLFNLNSAFEHFISAGLTCSDDVKLAGLHSLNCICGKHSLKKKLVAPKFKPYEEGDGGETQSPKANRLLSASCPNTNVLLFYKTSTGIEIVGDAMDKVMQDWD